MNMNKELEIEVARYLACEKDLILDALYKRVDLCHSKQRHIFDYNLYNRQLNAFILREVSRHILNVFNANHENIIEFISLEYLSKVWDIKIEELF